MLVFVLLIILYGTMFFRFKMQHQRNRKLMDEIKSDTSEISGKFSHGSQSDQVSRAIYKMLLYPIIYIVLWSFGMANRLIQATGGTSDIANLLQGLTQLVGFFNSLVYAYSLWKRGNREL